MKYRTTLYPLGIVQYIFEMFRKSIFVTINVVSKYYLYSVHSEQQLNWHEFLVFTWTSEVCGSCSIIKLTAPAIRRRKGEARGKSSSVLAQLVSDGTADPSKSECRAMKFALLFCRLWHLYDHISLQMNNKTIIFCFWR